MRAAACADVQAGLSGAWAAAAAALWAAAALALGVAAPQIGPQIGTAGWCLVALGAAWLVACGVWLWRQSRHRWLLRWDGQCWLLRAAAVGTAAAGPRHGRVTLMLDLQSAMLLRWRVLPPDSARPRTVWLALRRRGQAASWHGLRVALAWAPDAGHGACCP